MACLQLTSFLEEKSLLHKAQHGFVAGRSTLTNLFTADYQMSSFIAANHPFDLISLDFKKAFDKMPHDRVIESLSSKEFGGTALLWFSSFLTSRTQKGKVGQVLSAVSNVTSGVIQCRVLGPVLFTVFLDSLLRRLKHQATTFADNLKFGADVGVSSRDEVQGDIDVVCDWLDENNLPLLTEKYLVAHFGNNQSDHVYHLRGFPLKSVNDFSDLGVQWS